MYYQYFVSGGNVEDAVGTVGFFQVQTYGAENCMQGGPDDGRSLYPWVRWSCQSEGDCTTLPYNIVSKKKKKKNLGPDIDCLQDSGRIFTDPLL